MAFSLKFDALGIDYVDELPRIPLAPRAPRYVLQIPLRYRPAGDASWRDGRSENISRSGVLFLADYSPTVETPIELLLGLGGDIGHDVAGTLSCRGRVVRIEPPRGEDPRAAVAATIGGCEILHNQGDDPRRI